MLDEKIRRSISPGEGLALLKDREPDHTIAKLPEGTMIVSADSHFSLNEDIWHERFPAHLKDKAPRIWWDEQSGIYQLGVNFKPMFPPSAFGLIKSMEDRPGSADLKERLKDLDAEKVAKEIVFPQVLPIFFSYPDYEVREQLFTIYNEFIAEKQAASAERFFPVAIGNYWDPEKSADSIRHIAKLGLKTFLLPMVPGKRQDGSNIFYNDPCFDPLWAAAVDADIPVSFHIGEGFNNEGPGGEAARLLFDLGPSHFRKIFGQLVFGGIFDRFPQLRVTFAECGIGWVASAIQDAEMVQNAHGPLWEEYIPKQRPSYYWHNNCYATFMADTVGLRLLDIIGVDRVMWGVDYPHNEGSFGYTHKVIQDIIDAAGPDGARKIVGETAQKVFKL